MNGNYRKKPMIEKSEKYELSVLDSANNKRIDQYLGSLWQDVSRESIKKSIISNEVLINNKAINKANIKLKEKDIITFIKKHKPKVDSWKPIAGELDIIYEDEHLLIINKPPGLVTHPGAGYHENTVAQTVLAHYPDSKNLPRAGIVHRLDQETSGVMVIAKSELAFNSLTKQLKTRSVTRQYEALVWGHIIAGNTIIAPIGRDKQKRKYMSVNKDGKEAITHYVVKDRFPHITSLNVSLETGRTHQIRVHMAWIKHPIVGDQQYGKNNIYQKSSIPNSKQHANNLKDKLCMLIPLS